MATRRQARFLRILACVAPILSLLTFNAAGASGVARVPAVTATRAQVNETYGQFPLYFEANQGQTDPQVRFLARGGGHALFLTPAEATLVLAKPDRGLQAVLRMTFPGASSHPRIVGESELAGKVNYLAGSDPAKWRTNVPTYAAVRYVGLYPGIDLVFYGNNRKLEYDLVVAPGVDPSQIALDFEGADRLELDTLGDLVLHTAVGAVRQRRPAMYQQVNGLRSQVLGGYVLKGAHRVGFEVAAYDRTRPLVIDPAILVYSTYLGGSGSEAGNGIAVNASGNAYVTGYTTSVDFPTTAGVLQATNGASYDIFVTKLNPIGSGLIYSTYLGGSGSEEGHGIAVDASGSVYVTGLTGSPDFPTTPGAFQTILAGDSDIFVAKLDPDGSALIYSTYFGGSGGEAGNGIAVDAAGSAYVTAAGNVYVTGFTGSSNFPTSPEAFQTANPGGYSAFVTKLNPTGSGLLYSTYLGGGGEDKGFGIAVDAAGNAYVTGSTTSTNFPTTAGAFQTVSASLGDKGFVTKVNASGSGLVYSTYLGSGYAFAGDGGTGIAVDATGNAYVTGWTSGGFPTTVGAPQTYYAGCFSDAFVTKLNPTGSGLVYSTYLGGNSFDHGSGIAVDGGGSAYVTGLTQESREYCGNPSLLPFPTTPGAFSATRNGSLDAFVARISDEAPPAPLAPPPLGR